MTSCCCSSLSLLAMALQIKQWSSSVVVSILIFSGFGSAGLNSTRERSKEEIGPRPCQVQPAFFMRVNASQCRWKKASKVDIRYA